MNGVNLNSLDDLANIQFGDLMEGVERETAPVTGIPKMFRLEEVEEDADQPRKEFDLTDLRASIRANIEAGRPPIKTPISVHPHRTKPGIYVINDGARRYRSAGLEGLKEIPGIIDEVFDNYDQVVVNINTAGHTPLELAKFIARRETEFGEKKGFIGGRLGKPAAWVSKHAALLDMPPSVLEAYQEGRCRDVESLYVMTKAYDEHAAAIDAFCSNENQVMTQVAVRAFLDGLKKKNQPAGGGTLPVDHGRPPETKPNQGLAGTGNQGGSTKTSDDSGSTNGSDTSGNTGGNGRPTSTSTSTSTSGGQSAGSGEAAKVRKPILMVKYDDRQARLLVERRVKTMGLAWLKYDDNGDEAEVDVTLVSLLGIIEGA